MTDADMAWLAGWIVFALVVLRGCWWMVVATRPGLTLRDPADRNPMTDGCEMDADYVPVPARETEGGRS